MSVGNESSLDFRSVVSALRRHALLVAFCVVIAGGTALVISLAQTKKYTAEASLLFRDPGFDSQLFGSSVFNSTDPAREAATNVELVSLAAVADRTAKQVGRGLTGQDVASMVDVNPEGQANLVSVSATDVDPEFAATLANTFARSYIAFRRQADRSKVKAAERSIQADLERLRAKGQAGGEAESLQSQLSKLRTLEALQTGNAELVQTAEVPSSPSFPRTRRNLVLAVFLGLLLGVGVALLRERFDRRLREPGELETVYGMPALANVPLAKALTSGARMEDMGFAERESFRMLRARLRYFNVDRDLRSLLVTSASPGEGKSTVAWNLAASSAASGARTILIEADFHQPVVASRSSLAPIPGLSELLTHQGSLVGVTQHVDIEAGGNRTVDGVRTLDVLVAGALPPNPMELLESSEFSELLTRLEADYELIVVDSPPMTVMADAIPVIERVSGVIVVGRLDVTTRDAAGHLCEQLQRFEAPVLGLVINGVPPGRGYHYYYANHDSSVQRSRFAGLVGRMARSRRPRTGQDESRPTEGPASLTLAPARPSSQLKRSVAVTPGAKRGQNGEATEANQSEGGESS